MASKCSFPVVDFPFPVIPGLPSIPLPDLDFGLPSLNLFCPLD